MLSPSEFEQYCRIAREQKVFAFKLGPEGLAVQFGADTTVTDPVQDADRKTAGGWKRGPDLDADPQLDWD